ncbi:laccase-2 [Echria macrotheca]|uniref:Laccase-2 n=1 Tax=Echria macrotheca TaxID=438768 RepID=A0AAJ0B467_9PEZI|nr:laccase-2 [Echria macrotheca]
MKLLRQVHWVALLWRHFAAAQDGSSAPGDAIFDADVLTDVFEYPELPVDFLYTEDPVTPLPQGVPWGAAHEPPSSPATKLAKRANPWEVPPLTGVIRRYNFKISRQKIAPDGYQKSGILINGQFPGPLIEANWGDTIVVTVKNDIKKPEEGTALHWHGLIQKNTPWEDGVPSVTQCPIAPGQTFTYTFIADSYGTSWYHSHFSGQYADGSWGPIVIHGPKHAQYDVDLGPILVTDHYHRNYTDITQRLFSTDFNVVATPGDNSLINGRNDWNCSLKAPGDTAPCKNNAGIAKFKFKKGKKHLLRFANTGSSAFTTISVDGHNLTVIANDFVPVQPYQVQYIKLGVGQRTDVIVEIGPNENTPFYIRAQSPGAPCANTLQPKVKAVGYFNNPNVVPVDNPWPSFTQTVEVCHNADLEDTVPLYPHTLPSAPTLTETLEFTLGTNASGHFLFFVNGSAFRGNFNHPILLLSNLGNNSYPNDPQWNVVNFGSNQVVRMVLYNQNVRSHPMHLHGHNFFVEKIGYNNETWDGTIVRPTNPQRRDTQVVPAWGYMVISFEADNPGAWAFHCHVAWHVANGLYVTVLERPELIQQFTIPATVAQTCRQWWAYTNTTVVDQIDSGL